MHIQGLICLTLQNMRKTVNKPSTLFEFLNEQYPDSPRTRIKKILQSGTVTVNNKQVTLHSYSLKPGDIIEINQHGKSASKAGSPFPVLYEDQQLIAIEKPAGISTSSIDGSKNVEDILSEILRDQSKGKVRSWVIHRLDKEVSGVLLFAKSMDVMEETKNNWDKTEKHYYALVEGRPEKDEGSIKGWLVEDSVQKVHSTKDPVGAKFAITEYKVISQQDKYTLLDVTTKSGRKHQIRVHLSEMGYPIVGDRKYGASADFIRRIRLHAYSLSFPHPVSGKLISIQSPMPKSFLIIKDEDEKYK